MVVGIIFGVIVLIFCFWLIFIGISAQRDNTGIEKEIIEAETSSFEVERLNWIKKGKAVYYTAQQSKKAFSEMDENELEILRRSFGANSIVELERLYELGENQINEEKERELQALRVEENIEYKKNEALSNISGKYKYLSFLYDRIEKIKEMDSHTEENKKNAEYLSGYRAKTSNEYFWAGLAGGGLAGALVATDIRSKNAAAEESASRIRQEGRDFLYDIERWHEKSLKEIEICSKIIGDYDSLLFDDSNVKEKFDELIFSNVKFEKLPSGNIRVCFDIGLKHSPKILNKNAILDGSIKLNIKNKENEYVASGYYIAPGVGNWLLLGSGFDDSKINSYIKDKSFFLDLGGPVADVVKAFKKIEKWRSRLSGSTICVVGNYEKNLNLNELKCEFEPISIWAIEDFIFQDNNDYFKIINDYKRIVKEYKRLSFDDIRGYKKIKGEKLCQI